MDIIITEFQNRKKPNGIVKRTTWGDLVERLKNPVITDETIDEYAAMTNEEKTETKDVGGYVAGEFEDGKRSKEKLKNRYILTIDADDATDHDVDDFSSMEDYVFFVHTTHTSTAENPRLRWLFPLSRPVTSEEYRLLVCYMKALVGADTIDETTDQPERLMFWPSVSLDADYQFWSGGGVILNPDDILDEIDIEDTPVVQRTSSKMLSDTTELYDDGMIPEGSRNQVVFRYASGLRERGLDEDILFKTVDLYNEKYCSPPLPYSEIKTIINSVCRFKKGEKVPFEARDTESDFSDLGRIEKRHGKKVFVPEYESQEHLVERDVPPPPYLIDGLLPIGLGLLVAPAKYKKSWFCLDLAMSVATGTPFLDKETNKHDVLYCALEDYDYRLKKRSLKVNSDGHTKYANNLYFVKKMPNLQDGFLDSLEALLEELPKVKLVIVDTFIRIKGKTEKNGTAYEIDADLLNSIQGFAIDHEMSILLVHHTKKGNDTSDFANNINGSTGFNATMDVMLFLNKKNRKDDTAELEVIGREDADKTYVVRFDDEKCRWINMGESKDVKESDAEAAYRCDPVVKTIKKYLAETADLLKDSPVPEIKWITTAQGLLDAVDQHVGGCEYKTANAISAHLSSIVDLLEKQDGIMYEFKRSGSKREHIFTMYRE